MKRLLANLMLASSFCFPCVALSQASAVTTASTTAFNNNPDSFRTYFGFHVSEIRTIAGGISCGLLPKSALPVSLAGSVEDLLRQAKVSFGDGHGQLSVFGAGEFWQAVSKLYQVADAASMGASRPTDAECKTITPELQNAVHSAIKNGTY